MTAAPGRWRAVSCGAGAADVDKDVVPDLLSGSACHRLLNAHRPLTGRSARQVVGLIAAGARRRDRRGRYAPVQAGAVKERIMADHRIDPAVRALITAINDGDRAAFFDALTPGATMSDDGTDRDLAEWAGREIFSWHGHLEIESAGADGRSPVAAYRNDAWGQMRTRWAFTVTDGRVSRFEAGQA